MTDTMTYELDNYATILRQLDKRDPVLDAALAQMQAAALLAPCATQDSRKRGDKS